MLLFMNRRRFVQSLMSACVAVPVSAIASKFLVEPQSQDVIARLDRYKVGLEKGYLTVNQVRAMEDLPSVEDSELLETRELSAREICRIFKVPYELSFGVIDRHVYEGSPLGKNMELIGLLRSHGVITSPFLK